MTDEKKAEKIANKKCHKMFCYAKCNVNKNHHCGEWHYNKECALEGIEYGLAEGRKEKCLEQNNDGTIRPCEVMKENEQLEKENEILVWRILELQKTCGSLTDKVEKMKNCHNCKNWNWKHSKCEKRLKGDCFKNSKWELKE